MRCAEVSPGFVWRLKDDTVGNATELQVGDDPTLIPNLSVWESVEDLERFTFGTVHAQIYKQRETVQRRCRSAILRHVARAGGDQPTLEEAMAKLAQINADGPSDDVFGMGSDDKPQIMDGETLCLNQCTLVGSVYPAAYGLHHKHVGSLHAADAALPSSRRAMSTPGAAKATPSGGAVGRDRDVRPFIRQGDV